MPARIVKGRDAKGVERRWIQGIASTEAKDFQNEIIKQEGIDTTYFMNNGYFNYDHRTGAENKVGEPTECKVTKDGLWVKGFLYNDKKTSDDVWEHITALEKSGAQRKMGFSVEGKVIRKNGNVIEKCMLMDVAITPAPVNATTWAEIAKSLSAQPWDFTKDSKKINKALSCTSPAAKTESIDEEEKDVTAKKGMTLEEVVALVKSRCEGISDEGALTVSTVIFNSLEEVK